MPTLDELALQHGTDKSSAGHGYMAHYTRRLGQYRDQPLTLLELGVKRGASLRVWRDYFSAARIVGLDQRDPIDVEGCTVIQGQQDDPAVIGRVAEHGPFHVIVDDASHVSSLTIASFALLWPHLAPGGIYVVEDTHSSYWPWFYGDAEADPNPVTKLPTAMNFLKRLADQVNYDPDATPAHNRPVLFDAKYWLGYHIAGIEFAYDIAFITKAGDWPLG